MIIVRHRYISPRNTAAKGGKSGKVVALERALANVKYIQHRPGKDKENGGREFFSDDGDNLDGKDLRKAIKAMKNPKVLVHQVTLSPEIDPADKKAFTREVLAKLGQEKGLDLKWFAVQHENTAHPHVHIVILGKDKNGTDVMIKKEDHAKLHDYADRYLERCHPLELERSRLKREQKEKDRLAQREKDREAERQKREGTRQERIRDGLELPWLHRKIIREQLEPYNQWKEKQLAKERDKQAKAKEPEPESEKPYFQDTIEAAGKEWSKQNTLRELRELNRHLWDNYEDSIEKPEYKKLVSWIKEKERLGERSRGQSDTEQKDKEPAKLSEKQKDNFEYQGQKYSKDSSYEKLTGLTAKLRDKDSERLPIEEYQQLRGWIENADRARWSGVLEREMAATDKKFYRSKTMEDLKAAEGGRVLNPLQDAMMGNPVVRLFMIEASIANEIVRSIPLDDRNRDYLKEGRDELEAAKKDKHQQYVKPERTAEQRERDKETIEKLDKAIDKNQEARDKANEGKKKKKDRGEEDDPFMFDPWGRY